MKKTLSLSLVLSLVSFLIFLSLTILQVNFYSSFSLLIVSISFLISSISLKVLENLTKIKIVSFIALLINSIIVYSLFSTENLRTYEWLSFTPLLILVGIALSHAFSNQNNFGKLTGISIAVSTIIILSSIVFKIESPIYYSIMIFSLVLSSLGVILSIFKK